MALSGSFKTSDYNGRYLLFAWTATQNTAQNTSTITWTLHGAGEGEWSMYTSGNFKVVIDGETVYSSATRITLKDGTLVASGSKTIQHNDDGSRTFTAYAEAGIYYYDVNCSGNASWALDMIPRGATITSAPNFNDEQNPTIHYSNLAGEAVTSLQACISVDGNILIYKDIDKTGTSYTFNFTDAERATLRKTVVGGNTRTIRFLIITVIGENTFSSPLARTYTIVNGAPTLNPTVKDGGSTSTVLTGNSNRMIQYFNSMEYTIGAAARKEATIVSQSVTCAGIKNTAASGYFANVDSNVFVFTATDSRGNTVTKTITVPMVSYIPLTCNVDAKIALNDADGTKADIDFIISGNYFNGSFGSESNSLTLAYSIISGSDGGASYQTITIPEDAYASGEYSVSVTISDLDYRGSYTIKAYATDAVSGEVTSLSKVLKAVPVFDWGESDFNFNVPVSINGVVLDYIVEQGEQDGWYYRKWNSGIGECWKFVSTTTQITNLWGSIYTSPSLMERQRYPFVFAGKPIETVTAQASVPVWVMSASNGDGVNGSYSSAKYHVCSPGSYESLDCHLSIYCIGKC